MGCCCGVDWISNEASILLIHIFDKARQRPSAGDWCGHIVTVTKA